MTIKMLNKQIKAICEIGKVKVYFQKQPYPIRLIRDTLRQFYAENKNELSVDVLLCRLVSIEEYVHYAPNAIISIIFGLLSGFLLALIIDKDLGFSSFGNSIEKGVTNLIQIPIIANRIIAVTLFLIISAFFIIIYFSIPIIAMKWAYFKGKQVICDNYSIFIADYERSIIHELLCEKGYSDIFGLQIPSRAPTIHNIAKPRVIPKKLHRLK